MLGKIKLVRSDNILLDPPHGGEIPLPAEGHLGLRHAADKEIFFDRGDQVGMDPFSERCDRVELLQPVAVRFSARRIEKLKKGEKVERVEFNFAHRECRGLREFHAKERTCRDDMDSRQVFSKVLEAYQRPRDRRMSGRRSGW